MVQTPVKQPENQANKASAAKSNFFGGGSGASFFQAKLTVNQPGDKYEQEADVVADKVVNKTEGQSVGAPVQIAPISISRIQREAASPDKDEEPVQRKEQEEQEPMVQRMEDSKEEEVQRMSDESPAPTSPAQEKEEEVQRKEEEEEEKGQRVEKEEEKIQTKSKGSNSGVSQFFENGLRASKGNGQGIPQKLRSKMESGFGLGFGTVRLHVDTRAAELSESVNAKAFTHGSDIYFGNGQFDEDSQKGQLLLAHELTHTVQQGAVDSKKIESIDRENNPKPIETGSNHKENVTISQNQDDIPLNPVNQSRPIHTNQENKPSKSDNELTNDDENTTIESIEVLDQIEDQSKDQDATHEEQTESIDDSEPSVPADPKLDTEFQAVIENTEVVKEKQKQHGKPADKAEAAKLGAVPPSNERTSNAQAAQVDTMSEQPVKKFDKASFKKLLAEKIADAMPQSKEEAKEFKGSNKLDNVKNDLKEGVDNEKKGVTGPVEEAAQETPDLNKGKMTLTAHAEMKNEQPGKLPKIANASKAAPKSKSDASISMEKDAVALDDQMKEAEVTEEVIQNSGEPTFNAALQSKNESQASARQAPDTYRAQETPLIEEAKGNAEKNAGEQLGAMFGMRKNVFGGVDDKKTAAKSKNELKRKAVADKLEGIYNKTKTAVESKLNKLETGVNALFDIAINSANLTFENNFDKRSAPYTEGIGNKVINWFAGLPKEVEIIFIEERERFKGTLDKALDIIASMVEIGLNEAMKMIADGRKEVETEVSKLSPDMQAIGREIADGISGKFDQLESDVESKQDALADMLSAKYVEQANKMEEKLMEIKEAQKSLLTRAKEAMDEVIAKLQEMRKALQELFKKAKTVVGDIIRNPGAFFDNIGAAVKLGFDNFSNNLTNHLKVGLFGWLMGNMPAGIKFPKEWDLTGIFSFIAQLLDLGWDYIRKKAVKIVGEPAVKAMEEGFGLFQMILRDGLTGLWNYIKEKIGDLKTMVIDAIISMIETEVFKAAIKWLLSLFNPVAGLIKIVNAVYQIIKFLIEKARQIVDFLNSILDSVADIIAGNIGSAAKRIEDSLAKAIPLAIGFMAALLSLGDLPKKVQKIIDKVRKPIQKQLDKIVNKAVAWVKKQAKKGKEKVKGLVEWWKAKKGFKDKSGKNHNLYFEGKGKSSKLIVASNPQNAISFINSIDHPDKEKALKIAQWLDNPPQNVDPKQVEIKLGELAKYMEVFMSLKSGNIPDGSRNNPYWIEWHKKYSLKYPPIRFKGDDKKYKINEKKIVETEYSDIKLSNRRSTMNGKLANAKENLILMINEFGKLDVAGDQKRQTMKLLTIADISECQSDIESLKESVGLEGKSRKKDSVERRKSWKLQIKALENKLKDLEIKVKLLENYDTEFKQAMNNLRVAHKNIVYFENQIKEEDNLPKITIQIGVSPKYLVGLGSVVGPKVKVSSDRGKAKDDYIKILTNAGYEKEEGHTMDHVTELMMSGPDRDENLWPYAENIVPNQKINPVTGKQDIWNEKDDNDVKSLEIKNDKFNGKYFIVKEK